MSQSNEIIKQLTSVANQNPQFPSELVQALYLQLLSNETPGLDLYGDSLRILQGYAGRDNPVYLELVESLYDHLKEGS